MERDRETIGLTHTSQQILAEIETKGWFREGQDIARFALGHAVRAHLAEGQTSGTDTRWNAGSFDKTGEIRSVLQALYPNCRTPVRLMEHFVNEGLGLLNERVKAGSVTAADLLD